MADDFNNGNNGDPQERIGIGVIGRHRFQLKGNEVREFEKARTYMMIAQIVAIVSLFIGGMLASGVAVVFAILACTRLKRLSATRPEDPETQRALKRAGIICIAISASAFVLNLIAVVFLYSYVADGLQSGNLNALSNMFQAPSAGSANTTWG